jgi:DNA-binding CsgD family transcriptional regulator
MRRQLETTDEHLRARTDTVLSYLDLMERPDALFGSVSGPVRRQLLAAFFSTIWVDDDGHQVTSATDYQPLVAEIRDAALMTTGNKKSAGDVSDASTAEQPNLYLKVICSSMNTLVVGSGRHWNTRHALKTLIKRGKDGTFLLPEGSTPEPRTDVRGPIATSIGIAGTRLDATEIETLVSEYRRGTRVSELAQRYDLHRSTIRAHLRRHDVEARDRVPQVNEAEAFVELYEQGYSLATIGKRYSIGPSRVRTQLLHRGVELRPGRRGAPDSIRVPQNNGEAAT